ncbi:uncharacterized protein LOC123552118 [Mercenaria mercenaria]|uniref:uncharacterized protein LOC123552118 n=1 Tax=Mercenaria mercenaria TaxID=6596 RepID=UPI00234F49F1|nr:uncharacterized protein LOC123552118 [Mercenaria mercenaria]
MCHFLLDARTKKTLETLVLHVFKMHFQDIISFGLFVAVCRWPAHGALGLEKREVSEPSCPDGWRLFGENCYFCSGNETANWDAAQAACFKVEGQLVEIESYTEMDFLVELKNNASCPYGWTLFGESCYLHSGSEIKTWDAAQTACFKAEGQLVEIGSLLLS